MWIRKGIIQRIISLLTLFVVSTIGTARDSDQLQLAALVDARKLSPTSRYWCRYVEAPSVEQARAVTLSLNLVSNSPEPCRPIPIPGGLLRVDLRSLATSDKDDQERVAEIWEELQFDPSFNRFYTKTLIDRLFGKEGFPNTVIRRDKSGFVVKQRKDREGYTKRIVNTVRFSSGDPRIVIELEELLNSEAAVVTVPYLYTRALNQIQGKDPVYTQIYGGLYYRFTDTPATEEELYKRIGVLSPDSKLKSKDVFDRLQSDFRAFMRKSEITHRRRVVDIWPTLSTQPGLIQPFVGVTHDIARDSIDLNADGIANLFEFEDDAREILYQAPNGTLRSFLSDGKGKRQDSAPTQVVHDDVPLGEPVDLDAGFMSCMRCHMGTAKGGHGGWQPFKNEAPALLPLVKFDLTTVNKGEQDQYATRQRLAGKYRLQPDKVLRRGREDQAEVFLRILGAEKLGAANPAKRIGPPPRGGFPAFDPAADQTLIVERSTQPIADSYAEHWWRDVTTRDALIDLGRWNPDWDAGETKRDPKAVFDEIIPREAADSRTDLVEVDQAPLDRQQQATATVTPLLLDDWRIISLRSGTPINRTDWALVRGFADMRAKRAAAARAKEKQP